MRKRSRILFSTAALVMMIAAIFFVVGLRPSLGQEIPPNRKPACSIFCGDGSFNSITLAEPPACFGGPLPAGDAGNHYNGQSAEGRSAICQSLKSAGRTGSSCPAFKTLMAACERDKKEPPKPDEKKQDCREKYLCCNNTPEKGFFYVIKANRIYSEPSTSSTLVDSLPLGSRVRYTSTTQVNGKTWYYVQNPGRPAGWMPGDPLSCTRPVEPPIPKRYANPELYHGRAALASAARG